MGLINHIWSLSHESCGCVQLTLIKLVQSSSQMYIKITMHTLYHSTSINLAKMMDSFTKSLEELKHNPEHSKQTIMVLG